MGISQILTKKIQAYALLDSGATSSFIHPSFASKHGLKFEKLPNRITVTNADGTVNKQGTLTHFVKLQLEIGKHVSWQAFLVANIGHHNLIIGHNFLATHNPEINWNKKTLLFSRCPMDCAPHFPPIDEEEINELGLPHLEDVAMDSYGDIYFGDTPFDSQDQQDHWLRYSDDPHTRYYEQTFNMEVKSEVDKSNWSSLIPAHYHEFGPVFSKEASTRMPTRKPYDHAIELLPGAPLPRPSKAYPQNPAERAAVKTFLKEEEAKGYIRLSKSPTAAPVFFVKKHDGSLRLV